MHTPRKTLLCLTALATLAPAAHAVTEVTYVVGSGGEFGTLDPTTGGFTSLGTLDTLDGTISGLGFVNGTLYGLATKGLGYTSGTDVFTINTATGAETRVGNIAGFQTTGATVVSNTFYALSTDSSAAVDTINPATLTATPVNAGIGISADGLLVQQGSTLYAAAYGSNSNGTDELFSINSSSGAATDIGDTGAAANFGLYTGVNDNGTVYGFGGQDLTTGGADNGALRIYTINTGTGAATQGAAYSLGGDEITAATEGPAASPAPEPSQYGTLALMGLGLGGLILRARRQPKAP